MTPALAALAHPTLRHVDMDIVRSQWLALAPPYDVENWVIPLPVWATRRYDDGGESAWARLRADLSIDAAPSRPMCVYVHVPFCSSKCGFCDCYSFALSPEHASLKRTYVDRVTNEVRLWAAQGDVASRPVSTVHLGGGTPTYLGPELLTDLTAACRMHLGTSTQTEWALESTVESLTPDVIETMNGLGYDRLHVGVQSLDDEVRESIGRRRPVREVLNTLEGTLELGWTVSVDMVCGLPGQTLSSFAADIETLIGFGIDGVSLYELLIYPQNRRWAAQMGLNGRSHFPNYVMFHVGAALLEASGYRKNTFNHWANERDDNRYFTFPIRDEDCLALGTIADGMFGDYHFRHPKFANYLRSAGPESPGLEGGLRRTAYESAIRPVTTAILSGRIPPELVDHLRRRTDDVAVVERWTELGLVAGRDDGGLHLLTNGSWFAGNMLQELTGLYPEHTLQR